MFNLNLITIENAKPVDPDLFSGFLKVIDDFSKESRNEGVNTIILASSRLIYEKQVSANRELLFISIDDMKKKDKFVRKVLQEIAGEFSKDYSNEIQNFKGNITVFEPFEENIRKIVTERFGTTKEKLTLKIKEDPLKELRISLENFKKKHEMRMAEFKEKHKMRMAKFKEKHGKRKEEKGQKQEKNDDEI